MPLIWATPSVGDLQPLIWATPSAGDLQPLIKATPSAGDIYGHWKKEDLLTLPCLLASWD